MSDKKGLSHQRKIHDLIIVMHQVSLSFRINMVISLCDQEFGQYITQKVDRQNVYKNDVKICSWNFCDWLCLFIIITWWKFQKREK